MVPSQPGVGRRSGAFLCCGARGGAAWQELGSRLLRCSSARKELACPPPVPSAFPWCSRQGQCATPARPVCWALWQSSPLDQLVKSTGGCPDSETTILCLGFAEVASPLGPLSMCPHQAVGGVLPCPCAFPRPPAGCWGYFLSVFSCCVTLHIPQARCGLSNPFWTSKNYRQ